MIGALHAAWFSQSKANRPGKPAQWSGCHLFPEAPRERVVTSKQHGYGMWQCYGWKVDGKGLCSGLDGGDQRSFSHPLNN